MPFQVAEEVVNIALEEIEIGLITKGERIPQGQVVFLWSDGRDIPSVRSGIG